MADPRALSAIDRMERALARIEAAAAASSSGNTSSDEDMARLREAHSTLRERVEGAVRQIDLLMESGGAR